MRTGSEYSRGKSVLLTKKRRDMKQPNSSDTNLFSE